MSWEEPVTAAPTAIAGAVLAFGLVLATQVAGLPGVAWAALPASVAALHAVRVRRSARANRMADRNAVLAFRWLVERAKTRRAQAEEAGDRACSGAAAPARQVPILEKDGDFWRIQHDGTSVLLRHSRGLALLARLVDSPGQGIHVRDLDAMTPSGGTAIARESPAPDGGTMPVAGDAGEVLDARARDEYRRRVGELRAELQDAEECHDAGRVESLRAELAALTAELAAATGSRRRVRRASSDAERLRVAITRRIRAAIAQIGKHAPELRAHFEARVTTGYVCTYEPDPTLASASDAARRHP